VVSGEHDWLMQPRLSGDVLAANIAGARHVVFEQSGHFPFIEEPEAFLAVVRTFLAKVVDQTPR
jgi:proline iminopeptidase